MTTLEDRREARRRRILNDAESRMRKIINPAAEGRILNLKNDTRKSIFSVISVFTCLENHNTESEGSLSQKLSADERL